MAVVVSHWTEVRSATIHESDGHICLDDTQMRLAKAIEDAIESIRASRAIASKSPTSHETLPIETIDISPFLANDDGSESIRAARQKVVDQVRHCWQELGFLSLVGHGIPVEDLQTLKQSTLAFLNGMSVAEKLQLNEQWSDAKKAMDPSHAAIFRGYSPPNIENVALNQGRRGLSPDDCEKFTVGSLPDSSFIAPTEFVDDEARKFFHSITDKNIYPENYPDFKASMQSYSSQMQLVGTALLKICALAIDLPEDFFVTRVAPGGFVAGRQRVIHYPSHENVDHAVNRIEAHTDGGLLTILWRPDDLETDDKSGNGGLEVLHEGKWKRAPQPTFDALTINIGDLFAWWSNGRFVSTPHRVTPPYGEKTQERLAYPFFLIPNNDLEVSPLSELVLNGSNAVDPDKENVKMRFGAWFGIRSKHLAGIDVDLDGIPNISRPDIYKNIE